MLAASKRVRTIYSVIASPNRLEVLKILNTRGPLTYSELKALAGFKSKKESGKFAYHLRKLVRQNLIVLNRGERRYTVTGLGQRVLNLTRQIEDQVAMESGKLYVRTSRQAMEEFNSDRILQSLVRESGMPVELARKITSETESRLQKSQTTYLTAPLIREMVNTVLIEHGYEQFRKKLTRLGLPVYDVTQLIQRAGQSGDGLNQVLSKMAEAVFSEYLLLDQLPPDVADAHLSGELHISNAGLWGVLPDTLFADLLHLSTDGVNLGNSALAQPRIHPPQDLRSSLLAAQAYAAALAREATAEVSLRNLPRLLSNFSKGWDDNQLTSWLEEFFVGLGTCSASGFNRPAISVQLPAGEGSEGERRILGSLLESYRSYAEMTPQTRIKLILQPESPSAAKNLAEPIFGIVRAGGAVAVLNAGRERSYVGITRPSEDTDQRSELCGVLHSLALNLPRMAYESVKDLVYFRAKLALLVQQAAGAMAARRRILQDGLSKGLLPSIGLASGSSISNVLTASVNLSGLSEALTNLLGEKASAQTRVSGMEKILETARKAAGERPAKNDMEMSISICDDGSGERFVDLDAEKYGRPMVSELAGGKGYGTVPVLTPRDGLTSEDDVISTLFRHLNGGFAVTVDLNEVKSAREVEDLLSSPVGRLDFLRFRQSYWFCGNCGAKSVSARGRCGRCRSASGTLLQTA